jgi:hypothetical protein
VGGRDRSLEIKIMKGILPLLALSMLVACRRDPEPYTQLRWTNDPSLGAAQSASAQEPDNRDPNEILAEAVHAAVSLVTDGTTGIVTPDLLNTNVTVRVSGGEATLAGLVNNSHEKWLLETRARSVPGVTSVVNRLQIGAVPAVVPDFEKVVQP